MAARRSLTPFVATLAVAALSVGGVLVGTAPVSAAPALSEECTTALDALEEEFGDVDLDFDEELSEEVEAELNALFAAYEEQVVDLYDQLGLDYFSEDDVYQVQELALEDVDAATSVLEEAESALVAADVALVAAEQAVVDANEGGDPDVIADAERALGLATAAQVTAEEERDLAATALADTEAFLAEVQAVVEAIDVLDLELEAALDELLGDLPDIDVERLLELLTEVALECNEVDDSDGSDDDDVTGGGTGTGTAPVAKPVSARASFTG